MEERDETGWARFHDFGTRSGTASKFDSW